MPELYQTALRLIGIGPLRRTRDGRQIDRLHAHFDVGEGRVQFDRTGRRIGEHAERIDRGAARPRQQDLRGGCGDLVARGLRLQPFADLRLRVRDAELALDLENVGLGKIAGTEAGFGVVGRRPRIERNVALFRACVVELQRIERGNGLGEIGLRRRQSRRKQRVGPRLQHLLVADFHRHRQFVGLFVGDDVDGAHQSVALALADARSLVRLPARRRGELRRACKYRLLIEVQPKGGTDEREAAEAGQRGAYDPAQRRLAVLSAFAARSAEFDRRLGPEVDGRARALETALRVGKLWGWRRGGLQRVSLFPDRAFAPKQG